VWMEGIPTVNHLMAMTVSSARTTGPSIITQLGLIGAVIADGTILSIHHAVRTVTIFKFLGSNWQSECIVAAPNQYDNCWVCIDWYGEMQYPSNGYYYCQCK
jgi:hypothetical protein